MRFAIPLCVSFFCGVIPYMVLWDEVGFCIKTTFQARFFFRACLDCFQSTQNQYFFRLDCFLHTNLMKLRPAQLCKKTTFQALENHFFACLLSNLPTPPCYLTFACSKLCRCLQYKTKNALRIWGTLSLLGVNLPAFKNKNLRDPGPQAFGFFTSARAVLTIWLTIGYILVSYLLTISGWWLSPTPLKNHGVRQLPLYGSVSKPCTPGEHQNSWDLWMFIPLKMVSIGIDPYPYKFMVTIDSRTASAAPPDATSRRLRDADGGDLAALSGFEWL